MTAVAEKAVMDLDAVVAADELGQCPEVDERLWAELVPVRLGGRYQGLDRLAYVLRAEFRRDCTAGMDSLTAFLAAAPVWLAGSAADQRRLAEITLNGGRVTAGLAEFTGGEVCVDLDCGTGTAQLVGEPSRADVFVLLARKDGQLVYVAADSVQIGAPVATVGVRAYSHANVQLRDPVGVRVLITDGEATRAATTAVTQALVPSVCLGALDTQLRTAIRFAQTRRLYGRPVADLPHARSTLVASYLDLLVGDALCAAATTTQDELLCAAAGHFVPKLLRRAGYRLAVLVGARSHLREDGYPIFQKIVRDLTTVLAIRLDQVTSHEALVTHAAAAAPHEFATSQFSRPIKGGGPTLVKLRAEFAAALAGFEAPTLNGHPAGAGWQAFEAADRYAVLMAAAACVAQCTDDDSAWVTGALWRLAAPTGLTGLTEGKGLPRDIEQQLFADLLDRGADSRVFDLSSRSPAGHWGEGEM